MADPREPQDLPEGDDPLATYACPHCMTGTLHPKLVVFAHWFEGQFITIPNFPGWVCDICGAREYDTAALEQLETILGPEIDLRRETSRRTRFGPSKTKPNPRPNGRHRA
jgi:YgiT-type zinc finger domain-containing protein